jgi:hypothetical protein
MEKTLREAIAEAVGLFVNGDGSLKPCPHAFADAHGATPRDVIVAAVRAGVEEWAGCRSDDPPPARVAPGGRGLGRGRSPGVVRGFSPGRSRAVAGRDGPNRHVDGVGALVLARAGLDHGEAQTLFGACRRTAARLGEARSWQGSTEH